MSEAITVTGTVRVWMSPYVDWFRVEDMIRKGDHAQLVKSLNYSPHDMSASGWTEIGSAEISIRLGTQDERMSAAMESLQKQLAQERAESMQRQNAILDRISKLTAITYDEPEVQS